MTAAMRPAVHPAGPVPLGNVNDWRAVCPCDWSGPRRRTHVVAEADARVHVLAVSYGEPVVTS